MAATLAGLFKAHLESLGLGVPWYRDGAPADVTAQGGTYGVVQDGIGMAPDRHGDHGDPDGHQGETELVQIDLYQPARVPDPARPGATLPGESRDLALRVRRALPLLAGSYGTPPVRVYGVTVQGGQRWPISDNVVRHTWTCATRRDA